MIKAITTIKPNINTYKKAIEQTETQKELLDIIDDNKLTTFNDTEKAEIIDFSIETYIARFKDLPTDYKTLKQEAKLFSAVSQVSFIMLAERLKVIRDKELYKQDGYQDFKSFIINELPISKSTVYNYLDLLDIFGVQALGLLETGNQSKLIPALPLLKSNQIGLTEKQQIKQDLLADVNNKSFREIQAEIKDYKNKYLPAPPEEKISNIKKLVNRFNKDIAELTADYKTLSENDRKTLITFANDIIDDLKQLP